MSDPLEASLSWIITMTDRTAVLQGCPNASFDGVYILDQENPEVSLRHWPSL